MCGSGSYIHRYRCWHTHTHTPCLSCAYVFYFVPYLQFHSVCIFQATVPCSLCKSVLRRNEWIGGKKTVEPNVLLTKDSKKLTVHTLMSTMYFYSDIFCINFNWCIVPIPNTIFIPLHFHFWFWAWSACTSLSHFLKCLPLSPSCVSSTMQYKWTWHQCSTLWIHFSVWFSVIQ